jgi:hypothetical protein
LKAGPPLTTTPVSVTPAGTPVIVMYVLVASIVAVTWTISPGRSASSQVVALPG